MRRITIFDKNNANDIIAIYYSKSIVRFDLLEYGEYKMWEEEVSVFKFICYDLKNLVKAICSSIKETLTLIRNWFCIFGLYVYFFNTFTSMKLDVFNDISQFLLCWYPIRFLFKGLNEFMKGFDLYPYFTDLIIDYTLTGLALSYSTNLKELAVAFFILRLSFSLIYILVNLFNKIYKYHNGGVKILKKSGKMEVISKNKQWEHKGGGYLQKNNLSTLILSIIILLFILIIHL